MPTSMDNKEERKKFFGSLVIPLIIVALMWLVKVFEASAGVSFSRWGLVPHSVNGLVGIFTGTALYYCYPTLANRVLLITY